MIDKVLGIEENYYIVEGHTGKEFEEELKRLKKMYSNKRVTSKIISKAIIVMEDK